MWPDKNAMPNRTSSPIEGARRKTNGGCLEPSSLEGRRGKGTEKKLGILVSKCSYSFSNYRRQRVAALFTPWHRTRPNTRRGEDEKRSKTSKLTQPRPGFAAALSLCLSILYMGNWSKGTQSQKHRSAHRTVEYKLRSTALHSPQTQIQ